MKESKNLCGVVSMDGEDDSCNFLSPVVMAMSESAASPYWHFQKKVIKPIHVGMQNRMGSLLTKSEEKTGISAEIEPLHLQTGEWVQVYSINEINATLDKKRKYKGLLFMKEMEKFCGGRYRVFKIVETIKLEPTGEIRRLRSPTVFLEGVYCDGERHKGCDRACFHFWKEAWLKRISEGE